MTASNFIEKKVKPLINGQGSSKWTDERLVELTNEGMEELAKSARITRGVALIPLLPYTREVDLPEDLLLLTQILYNEKVVDLVSFKDMNEKYPKWQDLISDINELQAIIYDKQDLGKLTVYPLLSEVAIDIGSLAGTTGIILDVPGVERDSIEGLVTSVETYDYVTPENVYNPDDIPPEGGGITHVSSLFGFLEVRYVQRPAEVSTDDLSADPKPEMDIGEAFITPLKYYVAGHALIDESRNEAQVKSKTYINRYLAAVKEVTEMSGDNFQNIKQYKINYRTPFQR